MRKVLQMGWMGLLRMFKDRANWFFVFLMPIMIIILVGVAFGGEGGTTDMGMVGSDDLAESLVEEIDPEILNVARYDTVEELDDAVAGGREAGGVVVPDGAADAISSGEQVEVGLVSPPEGGPGSVRAEVDRALGQVASERSIVATLIENRNLTEREAQQAVDGAVQSLTASEPEVRRLGEAVFPAGESQFYVGAAGMVVLFVFITGLTGSAYLIASRNYGVTTRVASTPTSIRQIVVGEGAARWVIAFFQGVYIVVFTAILFGVDWGNLVAAAVLLAVFAAVAGGAAMLVGSIFNNEQQVAGMSVMFSLGLGALGGCMFPLDLFPGTMRTIAHFTPHAWAIDALNDLVYRGVGLGGILPELGVLTVLAAVLFALASIALSRKLRQP